MSPVLALAAIVVVGVAAQWLAARLRIPAIVFLLFAGIVAGPITRLLDPDAFFGDLLSPVVKLAVGVVLFEGGLSLRLKEARRLGWPLWSLVTVGLVVTFALTTFLGMYVAGLSWPVAATIGAILVVTGPTVIKPLLRQAHLPQRPANLLKWEGIVNDPFGGLLAVIVVSLAVQEPGAGVTLNRLATLVGALALAGAAVGAVAGWGLARSMNRGWVPEHLKSLVTLGGVLAVFAAAEAVQHESGLLAVTVMGVVFANIDNDSVEDVRRFKEEITVLLISILFIVLSARLSMDDLSALTGSGLLLIALVIFVVRPVAVGLATLRTNLSIQERALIGWVAPRGVVAAAVAGAFQPELVAAGYEDARLLTPIIFGVIIATVLLHGFTVRPLARRLGLAASSSGGLLLVGASIWSRDLLRSLQGAGVEVVVVDGRYRRLARARMQGLEVHYGNALNEDTIDELPLERIGTLLAASEDDAFNALVCTRYTPILGRDHVLQLSPEHGERGDAETHLKGRTPWGEAGTFEAITARYWKGARFKVTELTEEFTIEQFREQQPDALVMLAIDSQDRLRAVDAEFSTSKGVSIVYLP